VAFTSEATNLVPFDRNGRADVFARDVLGGFVRASEPEGAGEANGNSTQPDISADGRYVAFSSNASNLVYGDVNGHSDVFVRDLVTSQTRRVSVSSSGREGDGNSGAPAISADGRWVSFASTAANLVRGDRNRIADVFVHDLQTGRTERVSVSSRGREQNAAVIKPFTQVSDVGDDGRYVVFDSDADNLVGHDGNQDTDVFVRDRVRRRTSRVSVTARGREGNNDSFAPAMTPDTHFVVFESFAENLAPHNGPRENVFVRDVARGTTEVVDLSAAGRPAAPRRGPQLLQQAAIARDGSAVAFASRAGNLVPGDNNRLADLFLRIIAPASP
jgi:Tol biopolymer transport system component